MARFSRMQVLNAIYEISLVPVFYHGNFETARNVMAAISRDGGKLVEFVNRGDHSGRRAHSRYGKAAASIDQIYRVSPKEERWLDSNMKNM
jgi:hypothetical protein